MRDKICLHNNGCARSTCILAGAYREGTTLKMYVSFIEKKKYYLFLIFPKKFNHQIRKHDGLGMCNSKMTNQGRLI